MYCMKCGRDAKEGQVFCESCLQIMDQHPVKPDTVVYLPRRNPASTPKKTRKRVIPPEEQVIALKKRSRKLTLWLVLSLLLLGISLTVLTLQLLPEETDLETQIPTSTYRYIP